MRAAAIFLLLALGPSAVSLPSARAAAGGPKYSSGKDLIDWVRIPGGSFLMGNLSAISPDSDLEMWDEGPPHTVRVAPFELARSEVTFRQYRACVDAGACTAPFVNGEDCFVHVGFKWEYGKVFENLLGDDQPVMCVGWEQAREFSYWVGGRLPTEAEWEYAARSAGKFHFYPGGHTQADCTKFVMAGPGLGCGLYKSWPVCSMPRGNTEQGLCDMAGNVWEWTEDWYHPNYLGAPTDGSAWLKPKSCCKVRRGGSWHFSAREQRTLERTASGPGYRYIKLGFRPARSPKKGK